MRGIPRLRLGMTRKRALLVDLGASNASRGCRKGDVTSYVSTKMLGGCCGKMPLALRNKQRASCARPDRRGACPYVDREDARDSSPAARNATQACTPGGPRR